MKRFASVIFVVLLSVSALQAQLPGFYKNVERLTWVVQDLEKTIAGWEKLGITRVARLGEVELPDVTFRGKPVVVRALAASAMFGDVAVDWIQPLGGENAYMDYMARRGEGVFSLLHRAPDKAAFDGELSRLGQLGVKVLQAGTVPGAAGNIEYAYLDTEPEGKYVLGLFHVPGSVAESPLAPPPGKNKPERKVVQYAFVVNDLEPVGKYWQKLGFPEMAVTHPYLWDLKYHDQPGEFDAKLGWHRHGTVTYEWILPLKGPTVYQDYMDKHGEGFHHLAFQVDDFFKAVEEWNGLGYQFIQGGAWGDEGKSGYGRFAYQRTENIGGIDVELLWNFRGE